MTYHAVVGFNPFRPQTRTATDIVLVVVTVLVVVGFVLWASLSG